MCGRYAATANPDELIEEFEVEQDRTAEPARSILRPPDAAGRHAGLQHRPQQAGPVVLAGCPATPRSVCRWRPPVRQLRLLTWGLVPSWAKDTKVGMRMINARAESVLEKGVVRQGRRARGAAWCRPEGWYEWQKSPTATDAKGKPRKQPFFTHRADGDAGGVRRALRVLAGPRGRRSDDPDAWLTTFTIITDRGRARAGPHPRPAAARARARGLGHLARPRDEDPDDVRRLLELRAGPAASRPTRSAARSAPTATTARSCSSRRRRRRARRRGRPDDRRDHRR